MVLTIQLFLATIVSVLHILTTRINETLANPFYGFVINYQAIQIIVQLVCHLFDPVNIITIANLFDLITRKLYQKREICLDPLKWRSWHFDTSLPFRFFSSCPYLLVSLTRLPTMEDVRNTFTL